MQEVLFPVLFPEYEPPAELSEAFSHLLITSAEVDQAARSIHLEAHSETYLPQKTLHDVESALRHRYGLREMTLLVTYPAALLPTMEFRDLAQVFIRAHSPAAAILAGA